MHDIENIEEWRDVVGYEGKYQVSNMGQVKSLNYNRTKQEKILRQRTNGNGYLLVGLCKDGIRKFFQVHRLVAITFIPNPLNLPTVNHIDENPSNNQVDNLEWCTYQYNNTYGTVRARRVANTDWKEVSRKRVANTDYKAIAEKLTNGIRSKQVYQYTLDGNLIKIWDSTAECGRQGFHQGSVAACCRGVLKTHRGFIWSYHPINKKSN